MEKLFKLKEHGTNVRTEIIAGLTTFLSMAYILAVNPNILSASGMPATAVFTATAISAAFATIIMGVFANYPVALASGMGLNAYFSFTVCSELAAQGITDPWKVALTAILVEGVIFIVLSIFKFRETMFNAIPKNLKLAITAGIGLFIAFIGLHGAGIVVNDDATLVTLGSFKSPQFVLCMVGVLIIAIMLKFKIKGAILWGILLTWGLGMIAQLTGWYVVDPANEVYSLFPSFKDAKFLPPSISETFFKFDFGYVANHVFDFIVIVFTFFFVDVFDTVGTLIGVASKANMIDKDGKLPKVGRALMADAVGTVGGAIVGTSTVTSYVESATGVAEGGRTGLTAVTTAIMFVVALFLSPIFLAIPSFATATALIIVGLFMISAVKDIDFENDMADAIGSFMAIIMMPLTYSIANGIMFGMLAWVIVKLFTGKIKDIHWIMYVICALFVLKILSVVL